MAIAFWRNAFGAGISGVLALARHRAEFATIHRRGWAIASLAGLFLAVHFGTWVPSVKLTTVASATALVATQSVFSGLIAALSGRTIPRLAWAGMALAIVGTAAIAGADFGISSRALTGDCLALVAGLFAALYVNAGSTARKTMSTSAYTTICYSVCAIALLAACVLGRQSLGGYSTKAWVLIVAVTVCAQMLGHTLFHLVLRSTSATVIGLAILFETPGAALIAAVWLHQSPPSWAVPGLLMLFAGLAIVVRSSARRPEVIIAD
jgi:drug/metabolite transporter (DMT)-like permease